MRSTCFKRNNLDLLSKYYEIPQAQADVLTASLRANPVFYADAQLIPYGQYTRQRPGGQTQYDVNVSHPAGHHRQAKIRARSPPSGPRTSWRRSSRTPSARAIDNLYTVYVNVLAARETVRYTRQSVKGLEELVAKIEELFENDFKNKAELNRARVQRRLAEVALADAEQKYSVGQARACHPPEPPPAAGRGAWKSAGRILDTTLAAAPG